MAPGGERSSDKQDDAAAWRHGDVLPLPALVPPRAWDRTAVPQRYLQQRLAERDGRFRREQEAVDAINWCYSATARGRHADSRTYRRRGPFSAAQASAIERIRRRVGGFGKPPPCFSHREALQELLRVRDLYHQRPSVVVPFEESRLKILRKAPRPKEITDVAPPEVAAFFRDVSRFRRPLSDFADDEPVVRPYVDVRLRGSAALRRRFFRLLADLGLVSYRRRGRSFVGCFFVKKKHEEIRLVLDARPTNAAHRAPPHVALGTPAAWAGIDLAHEAPLDELVDAAARLQISGDQNVPQLCFASGDLTDSFYQFRCEALGEDFLFDFPDRAEHYSCRHVFEDGKWVEVAPGELVYPAFVGIAMGWSWALWAIHTTVSSILARSVPRLLQDRTVAPTMSRGDSVGAVYVDNFCIFGYDASKVQQQWQQVLSDMGTLDIQLHELVPPTVDPEVAEVVGLELRAKSRRLRPKLARAWRLYGALHAFRRLRAAAGWQLRVLLGHVVHYFQLCPLALSVLDASYRFAFAYVDQVMPLWKSVAAELRVLAGLVFITDLDLAAEMAPIAFCGDSSGRGFALHVGRFNEDELRPVFAVRERWRFIPDHKFPASARPDEGLFFPNSAISLGALQDLVDPSSSSFSSTPPLPGASTLSSIVAETSSATLPLEPVPDELLKPSRWSLVVAGKWKFKGPIHNKEGRVALLGLQRAARCPQLHGKLLGSFGDNLSEICAQEKGRATDAGLRALCCRACALCFATEMRWRRRFVETSRNPSDYDSRVTAMRRKVVRGTTLRAMLPAQTARPPGQWTSSAPPVRPAPGLAPPPGLGGTKCRHAALPATGRTGKYILELFSGSAMLSRACSETGLQTALPIDILFGQFCDLTKPAVQARICRWIRKGLVWYVHLGTPCTSWSTASQKTSPSACGLETARFTLRVLLLCQRLGVHWSLENPAASRLWRWRPLQDAQQQVLQSYFVQFDQCAYGTPWKKPTKVLTSLGSLAALGKPCPGCPQHLVLRGILYDGNSRGRWLTSFAAEYPPALVREWACLLQAAAPAGACADDARVRPDRWAADLREATGLHEEKVAWSQLAVPRRFELPWKRGVRTWGTKDHPLLAATPQSCPCRHSGSTCR